VTDAVGPTRLVFKILRDAEWEDAVAASTYGGSALDHEDGFIHLSTVDQVCETAVRYFAGQEMVGILGWVPGASHQTLGACIISYNGMIRVGFKTDANVIPDVGNLVAAFNDEMADLFAEATEFAEAATES